MELTGKCKEDCRDWYSKKYPTRNLSLFLMYPDAMQWGVLVDFFEDSGIHIGKDGINSFWVYSDLEDIEFKNLESRTEAIKKANEKYNENT